MDPAPNAKFRPGLALCPHANTCPGCSLIDLSYPEQLAHKFELVRAELSAYGELAPFTLTPTEPAAETLDYRTRAKLVASAAKLGLYARGTHDVLDIPGCRVLDPQVALAVATLRSLLPTAPALAGVDVTRAGSQLLLTLIADEQASQGELVALADRLTERCPDLAGVSVTRRARTAVQLLSSGHVLVRGEPQVRAWSGPNGPYHYVAFGAFVQAHEQVARRIYQTLSERIFADGRVRPRVLELYAGSGSLALSLAARGAEVVAVESYGPACARLTQAADEQGLSLRVLRGDASKQLALLGRERASFDVVLVNPPRRGLEPDVRRQVAALHPSALGYVSCRPSTLARDLAHFAQLGLRSDRVTPFDMMPMTDQVESLAWLVPAPAPALIVRERQDFAIKIDKPPFVSTAELTARVRLLDGYESAEPRGELSPEVSGLISFTRPAPEAAASMPSVRQHTFIVLAKGVLRARGKLRGPRSAVVRYVRARVINGHSLLHVLAPDEQSVRRALRAIAHPVLGDAASDRQSARYFALKHGLDRCFLHLTELASDRPDTAPIQSALAPDLAAVLRSLEADGGKAQRTDFDDASAVSACPSDPR